MCWQFVQDILCSEPDCNTLLTCNQLIPNSQVRCGFVKKAAKNAAQPATYTHPMTYDIPIHPQPPYEQPRDWCRHITSFERPARKARRAMCRACKTKPVAEQNELYAELSEALAESIEEERERDDERRARRKGQGRPGEGFGCGAVAPPAQ
ncbi:hypothetical protein DHEL01_v211928 [Diaporthe helianthi]|uniref:Uncharacterized protein n=1 Tax=Diaporthe helianthi TaxID=158607 RepID=A0A2P5HHF1_DIAHE|nr:hypothetical protein DHEL01_v211928 [Diaporthe helianthi]